MKIKILLNLFSICILIISHTTINAQDCTGKFTVDAGPDNEVCEIGSAYVRGTIGGDATKAVWRGGKGKFVPSRDSLNIEYFPAPEEIGVGAVLTLVASNPNMTCPPVRDEMRIIVNSQPKPEAGSNQRICEGQKVKLNGTLTGQSKATIWKTNGSGKFDDKFKLITVYTPSAEDIKRGGCSLVLMTDPYGVCIPDSSALAVTIDHLPMLVTEAEKTSPGTAAVKLSLETDKEHGDISWTSTGSGTFKNADKTSCVYTPSAEDVTKGSVALKVSVATPNGACKTEKIVALHLMQ